MTNAQIIMANRVFLMQEGVIKAAGTGEMVDVVIDKEVVTVDMPEEIRTFNDWKRLGYQVQKGQHAVAKFQIWMPKKGKKKAEAEQAEDQKQDDEDAKMAAKGFYKKLAHFFTAEQVKPIEK